MQLSHLYSNPHGRKNLRDIIDHAIGVRFYPTPGSEHYKLLCLYRFHGFTHINDDHRNNNENKIALFVWFDPAQLRSQIYFKNTFNDYVHMNRLHVKIFSVHKNVSYEYV